MRRFCCCQCPLNPPNGVLTPTPLWPNPTEPIPGMLPLKPHPRFWSCCWLSPLRNLKISFEVLSPVLTPCLTSAPNFPCDYGWIYYQVLKAGLTTFWACPTTFCPTFPTSFPKLLRSSKNPSCWSCCCCQWALNPPNGV